MSKNAIITAIAGDARKKKFFSVVNSEYKVGVAPNTNVSTFGATNAFLVIHNGQRRGTNPNQNVLIVPDYVKFTCVSAPGAGDGCKVVWTQDSVSRYASGGTSLTTLAANTYTDTYSNFTRVTSSAQIWAGALTLDAATSQSVLSDCVLRATHHAVEGVAGDEYVFNFDGDRDSVDGAISIAAVQMNKGVEPAYIGPGTTLIGHLIVDGCTVAGAEYKVEVGWQELHHDYNA
jgi:hypothetical protein